MAKYESLMPNYFGGKLYQVGDIVEIDPIFDPHPDTYRLIVQPKKKPLSDFERMVAESADK